ncbi:ribonuclease J [Ruminococcaceae bacterium OttesenSCG-928-L11]|nr:ribonuclease J [Ruminococcaceae bacterium OttesenSCG-928-L11]
MPDNNEKNELSPAAEGGQNKARPRQPQRRPRRRPTTPKPAATEAPANVADGKPSLPEQANPDLVEALLNGKAAPEKKAAKKPASAPAKKAEQPKTEAAPKAAEAAKQPGNRQPGKRAPQQRRPKAAAAKTPAEPVFVENKAVTPENPKKLPAQKSRSRKPGNGRRKKKPVVRIIPLGGLGEVGKNITVYECENDAFLVDCGLTFPDEGMPGIDLVIPDFSYVLEIKDRIRGIVITHGHEDHIGSLAYLLKHVNFPVYATKLTIGLIEGKLKEHGLLDKAKLNVVKAGDVVQMGCMSVEYIHVNHSIPDACGFAINTPVGTFIQTGDFKIDLTPIKGDVIDLARFGELGSKGVLALLPDSTNAERPGSTASERTVGESFDKLFQVASQKRIIVASFASNVHRVQQIVDAAVKYKRKVAVSGRSMENVVAKSLEYGYLDAPSGVIIDMDSIGKYPPEKIVIITTGSQGEPLSALTRMAMGDHRKVTVTPNDCIIISATPIPGNEKFVTRVVNELLKLGAQVVYEKMYDVHVSGHACQDELKMMMALTKPKFFVPMHGEFKHLKKHSELAKAMGIPPENIFIGENGRVLETDGETMRWDGAVTAGKVLVDGLGVGDVGSIVLRDRKHLAEDGLIIVVATIDRDTNQLVSGPDIVSRGFVYVRESEDMMGKTRKIARDSLMKCLQNNTREWGVIKQRVKDDVSDYLWQVTKRNPMILPIIQEV